ncbi:hypothetical protein [Fastidiosibacter lacustris]|uniref:hypothetical protein n=1 Tax=Fastidiosibacter lacustris TaxID=2056695 RepID=UPI000E34FDA2|nr:hypothetical protein [Fastidiosibacter lacustris]
MKINDEDELKLPVKLRDHQGNLIIIYISYADEGITFSYLESSATYPEELNILGWLESVTKKKILHFPKNLDYIYEECEQNPENILSIFYHYFSAIRYL